MKKAAASALAVFTASAVWLNVIVVGPMPPLVEPYGDQEVVDGPLYPQQPDYSQRPGWQRLIQF